jgi:hypothetical protein
MPRLPTITALALAVALGAAPGAHAQLPASAFTITFPDVCVTAIRSAGASWDQHRRCGLSLTVQGQGEFTVSVVAVVVAQGRITRAWTSAKRQVSAGTHALSGRYFIPDDRFLDGIPAVGGEQAGATVSVDLARKAAVVGGDASTLLGKVSSSTHGVAFVLIADGTSREATTTPRFLRTETFGD